jgi:hypothetical protein
VAAGPGADERAAGSAAYVNFDGAVLSGGGEDARQNQSEVAEMFDLTGEFPEYGGTEPQRSAVLNAVQADWAPYDLEVVDQRPADGEYTMVLIGPRDHNLGMGIYGLGPVDCFDSNRNNVAMAFFGADDLGGMTGVSFQATQVSQELAHAVGLEHVSGSGSELDIMFPGDVAPSASFTDECFDLVPPVSCAEQHQDYSGDCPEADQQNAHRELLAVFGPATSDAEDPVVTITSPEDGDEFSTGDSFDVVVEATDDVAVIEVELFADDSSAGTRTEAPYAWAVDDPDPGEHELYALARDAAGNEAMSAVITIEVADATDETGDGTDGSPGGCQCRAAAGSPAPWLWLLAVGLRRRR